MIKAVNKEAAIRYAKHLDIQPDGYVLFDLGKELLIVCHSKKAIECFALEAAEGFVRNFRASLYDDYENNDSDKLNEKLQAGQTDDMFVQMVAKYLIKALENKKIYAEALDEAKDE